jgi:hypothetical protein
VPKHKPADGGEAEFMAEVKNIMTEIATEYAASFRDPQGSETMPVLPSEHVCWCARSARFAPLKRRRVMLAHDSFVCFSSQPEAAEARQQQVIVKASQSATMPRHGLQLTH